MKSTFISAVLIIMLVSGLCSCGSPGLGVERTGISDLTVNNPSLLKDFDAKKTLWHRSGNENSLGREDSLYADASGESYTFYGGSDLLPGELFQKSTKKGEGSKNLIKINEDLSLSPPSNDNGKSKNGLKPLSKAAAAMAGASETFELCAKIAAVKSRDENVVDYSPLLISIHIKGREDVDGISMVHYYKNGSAESYLLTDSEAFTSYPGGIYSITVNFNDGDEFMFFNKSDYPIDLTLDCLVLSGLTKNASGRLKAGRSSNFAAASSAAGGKKSSGSRRSGFNRVRTADWSSYKNGAVSVKVSDVDLMYHDYFVRLSSDVDANGRSAIGLTDQGVLSTNVVIGRDELRKYPKLWDKYAKDLSNSDNQKPKPSGNSSSNDVKSNSGNQKTDPNNVKSDSDNQKTEISPGRNENSDWWD